MEMTAVFLNIDDQLVAPALREAGEKLDGTQAETVLDFSLVSRIDSDGFQIPAHSV